MMKAKHLIIAIIAAGVLTMASIRISRAGINKIKEHEALRLEPYRDAVGKWTIGYGHLIKPDEQHLVTGGKITEAKAEALLRDDLENAEAAINRLVKVPITGNQYDALVSFVFNVGEGAFADSTMLRKLNAGDYDGAAAEFPRWTKAGGMQLPGLVARRAKEQTLFLA